MASTIRDLTTIGKPGVDTNHYQGFTPGRTEVLPKGWNGYNAKPLESDIRIDHDVEIKVRDGCRLYIDVYRPADSTEKIPAIVGWLPYGKKYSALTMLSMTPWSNCVKKSDLSGLEKFEGLDLQRWCPKGYAIISVDSKGVGNSDGQVPIMGLQDAEDAYDVIEAIAKFDWCNENVGMAGNSALAIAQWHVAALNPPSLKAIAPLIIKGTSGVEDFAEMYRRSPLSNIWWEDKRANMKAINIPAYISGSGFSSIHTMGSIRDFMELGTSDKWIERSAWQGWIDLYSVPETNEDLAKYFNRYLKGIENDWEKMPKVRWTSLKFGDQELESDIVSEDFPPPNTDYKKLYLDNETLSETAPSNPSKTPYNSEDGNSLAKFTYTFDKPSRLIGIPKAVLDMSCPSHIDMNVFVNVRKLDREGNPMMHLCFPFWAAPVKSIHDIPKKEQSSTHLHLGSVGQLRASHRNTDRERSMHPQFPFHPHDREDKIPPGTIVKLEVGIWAMGVDYEAGKYVQVQIGGQFPSITEYKAFSAESPDYERNKGEHFIHCGPACQCLVDSFTLREAPPDTEHQSRIILPFVQS
ncbi:X-Pro dipeptidyl-peptidase C-terminal non-catalytic domain-containing protein [Colletotrichum salicis]|uniref:X-Pro dipeptidyl-peptidase C-terminal non-catalytic domain-containing protein n=1 Tax=Colletotrichum salicis TaxID=1209931 RepID=A0A135T2P1_9PEZI|nr:X-Pro dipeptidyl-peptidase C-terminal non-catalytic domain-containing protein [Colletotrichum salicis]